jgi:ABC-type glycerol-3-phosphate transport system substrate-binding protein
MNKKYLIIGGVIVLLLLVLGVLLTMGDGGNNQPQQKVELTWWKTFEESENVADLISEYQKTHKNVTISFVKKDIADYEKDLVDAIASGRTPDIFTIHNDWLPKHLDKIAPMPEAAFSVRQFKEIFVDVAAADFIKDNRIYALPMAIDVLVLYYNKDLLNSATIYQPPATWPELVSAVEKLTKQSQPGVFTRSGIALGTSNNVNRATDILILLMLQNGTEFYSDDLSFAKFDEVKTTTDSQSFNPGAIALEFYSQFANPAKKTYTWNTKSDFNVDAFTQGKLAMMLSYSYMREVVESKAPNLNWEIAAVPQVAGDFKVNFANYWGESVSKFSANQEIAWDFLQFVTQKQNLANFYTKHKLPSARRDILAEQMTDNEIGVFAENALSAKSVYKKDPTVLENIFLKMIDDVILKNFTPEQAVKNAAQQMNLSLQNN